MRTAKIASAKPKTDKVTAKKIAIKTGLRPEFTQKAYQSFKVRSTPMLQLIIKSENTSGSHKKTEQAVARLTSKIGEGS